MLVGGFGPHAALSSDHVDVFHARLEGVELPPVSVDPVDTAVDVVEAVVEVSDILVGEDDLVFPSN